MTANETNPAATGAGESLLERLRFTAKDARFHGYEGNAALMEEAAIALAAQPAPSDKDATICDLLDKTDAQFAALGRPRPAQPAPVVGGDALPPLPEWMENFTIPSDSGDSSYGFGNVLDNNLADRMRAYARAALAAQPAPVVGGDARLEELAYVPGAWRCPKCGLRLMSQTLHVQDGGMSANNEPQVCANGCGAMWRVTEREDRQEAQRFAIEQSEKVAALLAARPGGEGDGWMPISTAPKDGTLIDVYIPEPRGGRCTDVKWGESNDPLRASREKDWVAKDDIVGWFPIDAPTHWMRRPKKPAHPAQAGGESS